MGSSKKAKKADVVVPATPETAKRVDQRSLDAREDAQRLAAQRFGAIGTDITRGALSDSGVKKKKLGGD